MTGLPFSSHLMFNSGSASPGQLLALSQPQPNAWRMTSSTSMRCWALCCARLRTDTRLTGLPGMPPRVLVANPWTWRPSRARRACRTRRGCDQRLWCVDRHQRIAIRNLLDASTILATWFRIRPILARCDNSRKPTTRGHARLPTIEAANSCRSFTGPRRNQVHVTRYTQEGAPTQCLKFDARFDLVGIVHPVPDRHQYAGHTLRRVAVAGQRDALAEMVSIEVFCVHR